MEKIEEIFRGYKAIVVDDQEIGREIMADMLEMMGFNVDNAPSGEMAIKLISKNAYSIAFFDIQMPEMSGFDLTREIRAREEGKIPIPIVAVSADIFCEKDRYECIEKGMNGTVSKPVRSEVLIEVIKEILL